MQWTDKVRQVKILLVVTANDNPPFFSDLNDLLPDFILICQHFSCTPFLLQYIYG